MSGLASSFAHLIAARIGVGIGEGGAVPAAQSIIGDLFQPEQRFFAVGVYSTGAGIGALAGLTIGGAMSAHHDWRLAFVIAGLSSLAVTLATWLFVGEPARRPSSVPLTDASEAVPTMAEAARYLWRAQPAYRHLLAGAGIAAIPGYSLLVWTPSLFSRHFQMPQAQIGLWLGLLFGVGGAIGILLSSHLASRLSRRSVALSLAPPAIGCCLVGAFAVMMAFATTPAMALCLLLVPAVGYGCHLAPLYGVVHAIIHSRIRARAVAFMLLAANIAGFGLGPLIVGTLSDALVARVGDASLNFALLFVNFSWFWAAAHFWAALRIIRKDTRYGGIPWEANG